MVVKHPYHCCGAVAVVGILLRLAQCTEFDFYGPASGDNLFPEMTVQAGPTCLLRAQPWLACRRKALLSLKRY